MSTKFKAGLAALLLTLLIAPCAQAQETAAPTTPTADQARAAIAGAIQEQQARHRSAITGIIVGGAIIFTGSFISAYNAALNTSDEEVGIPADRDEHTALLVGLAVGGPIAGYSLYRLIDSQKQLNRLRIDKARVALTPDGRLTLALEF